MSFSAACEARTLQKPEFFRSLFSRAIEFQHNLGFTGRGETPALCQGTISQVAEKPAERRARV
jgi:hypothetical protein